MSALGAMSDLFAAFVPDPRLNRPFVVAQLGQSLDGRIATRTGDSAGLGRAPSLVHLHKLRAHVDAVVVGMGTVLADDPQLNVRMCEGPNPARIILDARGQIRPDARCLNGADGARRLVFCGAAAAQRLQASSLPAGVEVIPVPLDAKGHFELNTLAALWQQHGFARVLIEGGAGIVSAAVAAGIVDRLHLLVSPLILGSGLSGLSLPPIDKIADGLRPQVVPHLLGEGEVLFACAFGEQAPKAP